MNDTDINEAETRRTFIDSALKKAGWGPIVPFQADTRYDHCCVEEYPTKTGPADYILFHEGKSLACVEGKRVRTGPQNVLQQAKRYARNFPEGAHPLGPFGNYHLPFAYSTNGKIIWFQDLRDPLNLSREVAAFHTPRALMEMLNRNEAAASSSLGARTGSRRWRSIFSTGNSHPQRKCRWFFRLQKRRVCLPPM